MTIKILKETLIETGNPFVWITDAGWYFNEQKDSVKYTAEQVLKADTFEDLAKSEFVTPAKVETTPVKTKKK